jgi:hypothetical protein
MYSHIGINVLKDKEYLELKDGMPVFSKDLGETCYT